MAVKVEAYRGRLRLRWSYQGTRHNISLGFDDTALGRTVAQGKASLIDADLVTGNFDRTLAKYQSDTTREKALNSSLTTVKLFEQFTAYRAKGATARSMVKYAALSKRVIRFFEVMPVGLVDEPTADRFRESMNGLAPHTRKSYLVLMSGCWTWGIKQTLVTANPWGEVAKRVKVPPKQKDDPFTKDEVLRILNGFESDRHYAHYSDFVRFRFSTGCRPGEAAGLRWKHLSIDCGMVWIGESLSRGERKATKTNRSREFKLPLTIQTLLLKRRPVDFAPDDLVFPSPKGGAIDDHNFRNRAWEHVLKRCGVTYRTPYNTRHTFISHALERGLPPMTIAQMTGHDPEVLFKHYASAIGGYELPELF